MNEKDSQEVNKLIDAFMKSDNFESDSKLYREICIKIMNIKTKQIEDGITDNN